MKNKSSKPVTLPTVLRNMKCTALELRHAERKSRKDGFWWDGEANAARAAAYELVIDALERRYGA